MPPEAEVADEPEAGIDTSDEGASPSGGEAGASDSIAARLAKFDDEFITEYTGKGPAPADAEGAAPESDVVESPAKAGAASDDDDDRADPAADLRAEVAALREELRASRENGKGDSQVLEAAVSESPEIASIESEMREAEQAGKTASTRANAIISEHRTLETSISRLEGKLEVAADVDKLDIRDDLRQKRAELKDLEREFKDKTFEAKSATGVLKRLSTQRAEEVSRLKSALANRSTQANEAKAVQEKARTDFNRVLNTGFKKYGISPKSEDGKDIYESVKARASLHLRTLQAQDPNAPAVDVTELTEKLLAREAKARKLSEKKAFTETSTARRESRAGVVSKGTRLPASSSPLSRLPEATLRDPQFWIKRAEKLTS